MEREFLKPSEVGAALGLTTGRVYQLIAKGHLPSVRLGRSLFIPKAAWEAWLRQHRLGDAVSGRDDAQDC